MTNEIDSIKFDRTPDPVGLGRIVVDGFYYGVPIKVIDLIEALQFRIAKRDAEVEVAQNNVETLEQTITGYQVAIELLKEDKDAWFKEREVWKKAYEDAKAEIKEEQERATKAETLWFEHSTLREEALREGQKLQRALQEIASHAASDYEDGWAVDIAQAALNDTKDACKISIVSSRVCEKGTKSCIVKHSDTREEK